MTALKVIAIVIICIIIITFLLWLKIEVWKRNIEPGDRCAYYIDNDRFFAQITDIKTDSVKIIYPFTNDLKQIWVSKSDIYPDWC